MNVLLLKSFYVSWKRRQRQWWWWCGWWLFNILIGFTNRNEDTGDKTLHCSQTWQFHSLVSDILALFTLRWMRKTVDLKCYIYKPTLWRYYRKRFLKSFAFVTFVIVFGFFSSFLRLKQCFHFWNDAENWGINFN